MAAVANPSAGWGASGGDEVRAADARAVGGEPQVGVCDDEEEMEWRLEEWDEEVEREMMPFGDG